MVDAILYHINVILIYKYNDSIVCDWLAGIVLFVYWKVHVFQPLYRRIFRRII